MGIPYFQRKVLILMILIFYGITQLYSTGKKEVEIAYLADLSSRGSDLWVHGRNGIELALAEYNQESEKYHISLNILDDQGDDQRAVELTESAVLQGISIIIGPTTSGKAEALMEAGFLDRDKELLFLSATVSSGLFDEKDDALIRTTGTSEDQGKLLAQTAIQREGLAKLAIIQDLSNLTYTEYLIKGINNILKENGMPPLTPVTFNTLEGLPIEQFLDKIPPQSIDGLFIAANDLDSASIIQQYYKENEDLQFFTPSWANTPEFISSAGIGAEGSFQSGFFDYGNQSPDYLAFKERYIAHYSMDPVFTACNYYEVCLLLFAALEKVGSTDHLKIKQAILDSGGIQGLQEFIPIDPFGDSHRIYLLVQIQQGEAVFIKE